MAYRVLDRRSVIGLAIVLYGLSGAVARADDDDDDKGDKDKSDKDTDDKGKSENDKDDKDDGNDKDDDKPQTLAEKAADRFPQPVVVGTLIRRAVLQPLESQPILGYVNQVVRAPDGTIDVIVDYGGFFGWGARPIAVPVDAMVLSGQFMAIVEFTPAQLDKFPTYKGGADTPLAPDTSIKVALAKPSH